MPFPPEDKTLAGLLKDTLIRLSLAERQLARGGDTSTGVVAPTWRPNRIGQTYIRTDTHKVYVATGTAAASDWALLN